jgi:hypothetical protein
LKIAEPRKLRMLAGCEMSGVVRDAFAARGWEAWSADLLPTERPARHTYNSDGVVRTVLNHNVEVDSHHYRGDVRDLFDWNHPVNRERQRRCYNEFYSGSEEPPVLWDLNILFPPCDHLCLAGAVWWKQKRADGRQDAAAEFFMEMVNAPAPLVAVENPRGDMTRRYREPDQVVEPFWFGDPLRKKTCLWLKDLPKLVPSNLVEPTGRVATGGGSHRTDIAAGRGPNNGHEDGEGRKNRKIVRSRTMPGFAEAMASQWGRYAELLSNVTVTAV